MVLFTAVQFVPEVKEVRRIRGEGKWNRWVR